MKNTVNKSAYGSSEKIEKAVVAINPPSLDLGEVTDKGSLNQRVIIENRPELLKILYASNP